MKNIPFKGILAVGNTQREATEHYRQLAVGQNVAAFRDQGGTLSFISNSSSSPNVMFNPQTGQADIERCDSLIAEMEFVSESSTEEATPAMHAVCSDGCGHHFVFDQEEGGQPALSFCPICTCSVSASADEGDSKPEGESSGTSEEDEATKLLDGIGTPVEVSESADEEDPEADDDEGEEAEDDMALEDDVEDAVSTSGEEGSDDDGSTDEDGDEEEDDLSDLEEASEDDESASTSSSARYTVAASETRQSALRMFLSAPGVSVSSGEKHNVEYVVCSSAACGAHIMHNAPSLTQCPACLSAVVEPTDVPDEKFNLNQPAEGEATQASTSGEEGDEEDSSLDSDLPESDDDAEDGDGEGSEDDSTSESSSMKTASAFSKAGAMARYRDLNLTALVSISSDGGQVPAEYTVCSDADCGAHIVSESTQHFCPVCSAATEEPKSDDEAANIVGDLEVDDPEADDGEESEDDGEEVDLSLDEDEGEGDEEDPDAEEGDDEDLDLGDEEEGADDEEGEEDPDADADPEGDEGEEEEGADDMSESTSSIQVDAPLVPAADANAAPAVVATPEATTTQAPAAVEAAADANAAAAAAAPAAEVNWADTEIKALDLINDAKAEAHASLDVTFQPSVSGAGVWTAFYEGLPVAMARVSDLPEQARDLFDQPAFAQAAIATARQNGVKAALTALGFKSIVHKVPVTASLSSLVEERVAAEKAQMQATTETYADTYQAATATAAIGINRNFFKANNPLKTALCSVMAETGMRNPEAVVDKIFAQHFDQFSKTVQAKALEIMAKPAEVQASLASTVLDVNYQSSSSAQKDVEDQLSTIGVSVSKDAVATPKNNKPVPASLGTAPHASTSASQDDFDALLAKAVGGLGNVRR